MTWSFSTRDPGSGDNARSHLTTRAILTSEPHIQQTTTGNDDGRSHDSENHQETRQRGSTGTAAGRPRPRRMPPVEGEVRRRDAVPEMQGPAPALRVQHYGRPRPGQRCTGRLAADAGGALPTESLKRASENLPSGLASPEEPGQQPPGQTPRQTPVAAENDDAAPAAESPLDEVCTIDVINDDVAHYSGELSHWNFSMRIKRNIDTLMATSQVPQLDGQQRVPEFIRVPEPLSDTTLMTDLLKVLPPRPVASFLVHVFFTHATSFYFFLDQRWVMSTLDSLYQSPSRYDSKNVVPACAVTMVLAVGAQYVHLESPDRDQANTNWELEIGSTFYRHVARLLAEMIHSGSIISVQVCLLLGLYCLPLDASGLGYIYLNLAMKLAIQNGMHRRPVSAVPDALKEETRCRLWWTVYCLERKIGMFHGRPSAISRSNFDASLPTDSAEFSSLSGSAHISTFLDAIQLTKYAETLQRDLLRLRGSQRSDAGRVIGNLKQTKAECGRWWSSRRPTETYRVALHARLEHCLLEMFVGRPFILTEKTSGASYISERQPIVAEERRALPWSSLVQDCLSAATEAIEICHTMRTGPMGLTRSSYVEYSSCRAAMLVLLAYSIRDRTKVHGAILQRGLDAIRDMAYAGDSARSEVQLIETLEAALQHMNAFTSPAQYTPRTPQTVPEEGYEGFNGQPGLHVGPAAQLGEWIK
ncbi:fungal specific transcription factor [Apiospora marii]|uniref:fungal specific transcription factor n=1 Tax=Apiospora marii TaxID=335849 RepID=UPI003130F722